MYYKSCACIAECRRFFVSHNFHEKRDNKGIDKIGIVEYNLIELNRIERNSEWRKYHERLRFYS